MFYVLSPPEATDWAADGHELVGVLKRDWPGIAIETGGELPTRDVIWRISSSAGELEASQDRDGRAQYLDGPIESMANYAAWWRRQVPPTQPLVLYDETYTTVVPIHPGMTAVAIAARLE